MNIYHHHSIHFSSACAGCPCCNTRCRNTTPSETEAPRSRPSFLSALAGVARFATMLSLLHVGGKRTAQEGDPAEQDSTAPLAGGTAETAAHRDDSHAATMTAPTTPTSTDALLALFSQGARTERDASTDVNGTSEVAETPLSPLATAFLAAFRGAPTSA